MPRGTAEELTIESRRCQVAGLFLRGIKRQAELAQRVGVDRSTVSRDLKVLNARWKEAAVRDLDEAKGQELDRLDLLAREYWEAWERSKRAHETSTTEQTTTPDGERLKAGIRKEEQCGDPRYLAGVQWCISKRREILGLDAPRQSEVAVPSKVYIGFDPATV
jgi:DNA-binding transcriptional MocR family regulator